MRSRADDGPLKVVLDPPSPHQLNLKTKKKQKKKKQTNKKTNKQTLSKFDPL